MVRIIIPMVASLKQYSQTSNNLQRICILWGQSSYKFENLKLILSISTFKVENCRKSMHHRNYYKLLCVKYKNPKIFNSENEIDEICHI